jgi:hypothetical protein
MVEPQTRTFWINVVVIRLVLFKDQVCGPLVILLNGVEPASPLRRMRGKYVVMEFIPQYVPVTASALSSCTVHQVIGKLAGVYRHIVYDVSSNGPRSKAILVVIL